MDVVLGLGDDLRILILGDLPLTEPHTELHVVIQTGASLAELRRELPAAGGQLEDLVHLVHCLVHHKAGHIRPDVLTAVVQVVLVRHNTREGLIGDLDIAVSLIVLEQDIVLGVVQLDQAALQHQRFKFAVGDDVVKIHYILHHLVDLGQMMIDGPEVAGYPVLELLGLAHIDNGIVFILHNINSRLHGELMNFFLE